MLSVPAGSSADSGSNGDFTDGVATVQNPGFDCDVEGSYVLQLKAQNAEGWSEPKLDQAQGQTVVHIRTAKLDLDMPGPQQYSWDDEVIGVIKDLETAIDTNKTDIAANEDEINSLVHRSYLSTTKPTGVTADPEAVWQFDKSGSELNDRTANSHDLTAAGVDLHTKVGDLIGRYMNGVDAVLYETTGAAGLRITGALTVEVQFKLDELNDCDLFAMVGDFTDDTSEDNNVLYRLALAAATGRYSYDSENTGGANSGADTDLGGSAGHVSYLAMTRDGSGNVNVYLDGSLISGPHATTSPTAGTTPAQLLRLGAQENGGSYTNFMRGVLFSARVTAEEFTLAQVQEVNGQLRAA